MKLVSLQRLAAAAAFAAMPALVAAQALNAVPAPPRPPREPTEVERELAKIDQAARVEQIAAQFAQRKEWDNLQYATERLVQLRPHNGNYRYTLAAAHAMQDHKREAYDALIRLQNSGYAYDVAKDERFKNVQGTEVWGYLVQNLDANRKDFGKGTLAYQLPAGDLLIEALAWDPARKQLLAGSAREGKVYRVGQNGALEDYVTADAKNGLWAVMDMAVDAPRDALYVASAAIPHFKHANKAHYGRAGVFRFKLSSGEFVSKHEVPLDGRNHILSSIAVTPKGDVFAADGIAREIYKIEGANLRPIVSNPKLTTIRGMAASDKALYFADYDLGLFGLDLATGTPFEVRAPGNVTLYSIDGLSYWNGNLVVVQAGFPPKRVMRLTLTADGRGIAKFQPLEVNREKFGTPTRGTVAGDRYYFLANTQKPKYDSHGFLRTGAELEPTPVYSSDLKFGTDEGTVLPLPGK